MVTQTRLTTLSSRTDGLNLMAHSDRAYVGTGPEPGLEWVTLYYVKPSHCNLCGNLNVTVLVLVPVPFPHKF